MPSKTNIILCVRENPNENPMAGQGGWVMMDDCTLRNRADSYYSIHLCSNRQRLQHHCKAPPSYILILTLNQMTPVM